MFRAQSTDTLYKLTIVNFFHFKGNSLGNSNAKSNRRYSPRLKYRGKLHNTGQKAPNSNRRLLIGFFAGLQPARLTWVAKNV